MKNWFDTWADEFLYVSKKLAIGALILVCWGCVSSLIIAGTAKLIMLIFNSL